MNNSPRFGREPKLFVHRLERVYTFKVRLVGTTYYAYLEENRKYVCTGRDKYELHSNAEWLVVRCKDVFRGDVN